LAVPLLSAPAARADEPTTRAPAAPARHVVIVGISGLRWNQVDFERRQLHLIQIRTKNGDSRTIPLNAVALNALRELIVGKTRLRTDPVFPSVRTGDSLQGSRGWFSTALEEAKIQEYTWHCNRHTFASRLVMAGVDLRTVAELLGHRTLQMVMRYSHLGPEHQTRSGENRFVAGTADLEEDFVLAFELDFAVVETAGEEHRAIHADERFAIEPVIACGVEFCRFRLCLRGHRLCLALGIRRNQQTEPPL